MEERDFGGRPAQPTRTGDLARIRPPRRSVRADLHVDAVATDRNATRLRHELADWLAVDVPPEVLDDLVLAVYEAIANAAEHAYAGHPDGPGQMLLEAYRADDHVVVVVTDWGAWRTQPHDPSRRRGVPLMRLLTQDLDIERTSDGTVVHLSADILPP